MFFHLFIFFSLMNWSIPSYSGGKLTIRMIHVHIVLQCHSQSNMQKLVRNSVTCHQCRYFLHFSSFYSPSPILHFSFPPMFHLYHICLFIFFSLMNWSIPSYSASKLTIRMIHVHIVLQCHSQSNMQKLVRKSVTCHQCRYFLHFSSFYSPSPILHFSFPPMFHLLLCPA